MTKNKLSRRKLVIARACIHEVVHTPSSPRSGRVPNSMTIRLSSSCSISLRFPSGSELVGRANIHFCNTVHKVGTDFVGVLELIFRERAESLLLQTGISAFAMQGSTPSVSPDETTGKIPCHSPSFLATPRQIGSSLRSSGLHTRPRMNLYNKPF